MLAQASTTVSHPSRAVAAALTAPDHAWAVGLDGDGSHLLAKVGVRVGRLPVYKHVQLLLGRPSGSLLTDWLVLPVSWEAVGGPPILPGMEGMLQVEAAGTQTTKLTLSARYDPPLGQLGELIDRVAMHRVAQITLTDFVERLARVLSAKLEGSQAD